MRKIIAITQVTLDGVMQGPGGPEEDPSGGFTHGGWAMTFVDDDSGRTIGDIIAGEFDLLLGRRTYDIWASYWPHHADNPIGAAFGKATKYVVTHRPEGLDWNHSERLGGVEEVRRLKASSGPDLHLWGSSAMMQDLIAADLIDEHRLWVFPLVLGKGKRLFENGVPPRRFSLVETRHARSGVFLNTYRPAGPVGS
jgi:dihydrofolate reductase